MKKKIMTLALAAIFSMGVTTFAQNASQQDRCGDKKECCKKDGKKCDKKDGKKCDKKECKKGDKKSQTNLFEGLNLTEQQQAAIAQIPTPRQVMKAARDNKDAEKADRMSADMRRDFAKNVRLDYLKKVKGVLSTDQYVQFLENFYTNSSSMKAGKGHGDKMKGDRKKDGKKMGDMKKGEKRQGDKRQGKDRADRK